MNVIVFVTVMLMLLSIMTYGRLDTYQGFAFLQSQFKQYMEKTERSYYNDEAQKNYDSTIASSRESNLAQKNDAAEGGTKFSFHLFVDKDLRASKQEIFQQQSQVFQYLLDYLYGNQKFYQEMVAKNPSFVQEIIEKLVAISDKYDDKTKLKKTKQIENIDFEDPDLNEVFTSILRGQKASDPEAGDGYPSLLSVITIEGKFKPKIRVYLASRELLMGLFGSQDVVNEIIGARYLLYTQVKPKEGGLPVADAKAQFESSFMNARLPFVPDTMLDFTVSKTNPTKYEFAE